MLRPDGVDRSPIDAFTLEVPIRRQHDLVITGLVAGAASFDDPETKEQVAELLSAHSLGGINCFISVTGGGRYVIDLHSVMQSLVSRVIEHDREYDLDAEKERTRQQREAFKAASNKGE